MKVSSCSAAAFTSSFATNALRFPFNNHHSSSLSFFCWKRSMSQFPIRCSSTSPSSSSAADYSSMSNESAIKPKQQQPWLIVGLGNPGKKYQGTRHNVGFEMVDAIANAEGISISSVSFRALFGKGFIGNVPVMLAKPQTFMNSSGESVGAIVSYYKIPLKQVLLIYDDLDLPFAKLRLLPKGGHGGHNGMRSVIDHFKGIRDFPRLRVGRNWTASWENGYGKLCSSPLQ
ncbi:peptidyl-tRNA hydrolase, chloroplastic isoform X2 [Hevea brasiliensis]|uniref:peptidyl-tRNA hydrolase, chloroplastic isoform X2 n=1 Tax=Hevea brasiliensis TaxID=3981 RepID=UPI0025CBA164|nr:peptidyl-tRNA hydrolase, chloroplastic isoform X2 [Hevea brasiliensis]